MTQIIYIIAWFTIVFFSPTSIADKHTKYPEGFGAFFQFTDETLSFRYINENYSMLPFRVNFNTIKLTDLEQDRQKVRNALINAQIKQSEVDVLMSDLSTGINTSFSCKKVDILDCLVMPEKYQFVFDYEKKLLLLFVHPSLMTQESQRRQSVAYQGAEDVNPSVINHLSVYTSKGSNQSEVDVTIDDELIVGLPYGYIHSDVQYYANENDLDIYKFAYHLDYQNYQLRVGQFRSYDPLNATDFLRRHSSVNSVRERAVEVGSSTSLLIGKKNQNKTLLYFAPTSGRIIVRRTSDSRILLNRNTKQGQQSISYSELPNGVYDVSVEILTGGNVIAMESFTVFNQNNDTLSKGDIDFALGAGVLEGSAIYHSEFDEEEVFPFIRGLAASKIADNTTLGLGVTGSEQSSIGLIGTTMYLPYDTQLELAYNYATTGEKYLNSTLFLAGMSISYQKLKGDNKANLASTLFGYGDYERVYFGTSFPIFGRAYGRLSSAYTKSQNAATSSDFENLSVSTGISTKINNHMRLDLNLGYNDNLNLSQGSFTDKLSGSISINIDLDAEKGISYNSLISGNKQGVSNFRNTINANQLVNTKHLNVSGQVSNTYSRSSKDYQSVSDASVSAQYDNEVISGNAYASYDSNQNYGLSATFNSTQVIANKKMYFTSRKAQSYGLIDIETNSSAVKKNDDLKAHLTIRGTNYGGVKKDYIHSTKKLIPLASYNKYQMDLNTDIADLYNTGDKYVVGYAYPGSVVKVNANVGKAKRIVAAFIDVFNQPVSSLRCQGEGCIEMNRVVDGVYNLTVISELPYTLQSSTELVCKLNILNSDKVNYGSNYCFPNLKIGQKKELKDKKGDKKIVQYLGDYHPDSNVSKVVGELYDAHVQVYLTEGQFLSSVYITYRDEALLTAQQNRAIDSLLQYAAKTNSVEIGLNK